MRTVYCNLLPVSGGQNKHAQLQGELARCRNFHWLPWSYQWSGAGDNHWVRQMNYDPESLVLRLPHIKEPTVTPCSHLHQPRYLKHTEWPWLTGSWLSSLYIPTVWLVPYAFMNLIDTYKTASLLFGAVHSQQLHIAWWEVVDQASICTTYNERSQEREFGGGG